MKKLLILFLSILSLTVSAQYNRTNTSIVDGVNSTIKASVLPGNSIADKTDVALATRPAPIKKIRASFANAFASGADPEFFTTVKTGSGQTISQTGGNLLFTTGTTVNQESIIRSVDTYNDNLVLKYTTILSQRIVNQQFFVEIVDVIGDGLAITINSATSVTIVIPGTTLTSANVGQSMYMGNYTGTGTFIPGRYAIASVSGTSITFTVASFAVGSGTGSLWGWNYHQVIYQSTTATNASYDTQRKGYASGVTTATINTSASPGHMGIITNEDGNAAYADQLVASSTALQTTLRASRVINIPDEFANLYVQFRVVNGSTAPASTTTWTIGTYSVENYTPTAVSISNIKVEGNNTALPVQVLNTATMTVSGNVPGSGATNSHKLEDNAAASGDVGQNVLYQRNDALTSNVNANNDYAVPVCDIYGASIIKDQQRHKRTYSASFVVASAASCTDLFQLIGSATTTVEINKITISATQTTGGAENIYFIKRSTANTGGTSTSATFVPHISTDAAATAVGSIYTANPTTGTPVGNVRIVRQVIGGTNLTTPTIQEYNFGERGKPIILSGVAQAFAIGLNGVTVTGGSFAINVEITEY
jgi:hypothetical protein